MKLVQVLLKDNLQALCLSSFPHCSNYATAENEEDDDVLEAGEDEAIEPAVSVPPNTLPWLGLYAIEPAVS